jgi:hypothetical protein
VTPNALNDSRTNFSEYHNVYIEPCAYEAHKKAGVLPNGTIFYQELQLPQAAENPDGPSTEPSGRGYFPGKHNGADVTVKYTARFGDTRGWGYFNFHHYLLLAPTAVAQAKGECAFCPLAPQPIPSTIDDVVTANLFQGSIDAAEKRAWFLRETVGCLDLSV